MKKILLIVGMLLAGLGTLACLGLCAIVFFVASFAHGVSPEIVEHEIITYLVSALVLFLMFVLCFLLLVTTPFKKRNVT